MKIDEYPVGALSSLLCVLGPKTLSRPSLSRGEFWSAADTRVGTQCSATSLRSGSSCDEPPTINA